MGKNDRYSYMFLILVDLIALKFLKCALQVVILIILIQICISINLTCTKKKTKAVYLTKLIKQIAESIIKLGFYLRATYKQ